MYRMVAILNNVLHSLKLLRINLESSHYKKKQFVTLYGDREQLDLLW